NGTHDLINGDPGQHNGGQIYANLRRLAVDQLRQSDGNTGLGQIGHPSIAPVLNRVDAQQAGQVRTAPDTQRPDQGQVVSSRRLKN
ncbi:MAG: hypothetical protein JRH15_23620, partial [Deltaproteobacteria bacterium]|nr:hypothetical protein [Deltaproteobacteria bacterium]